MEQEFTLKLLDKKEIAKDTMTFIWEKPQGFVYKAGQTLDFTLIDPPETDAEGNMRTFSLVSAPFEQHLQIASRMRDTAFKRTLKSMTPGTSTIKAKGPFGSFTLHNRTTTPAVFVTGGIGITPVMSMIKQATHDKTDHKLFLFYSNHTKEDTAFLDELNDLAGQNKNFTFVPTMTQDESWTGKKGRISKEMIAEFVKDLTVPIYYICGPATMVVALRKTLLDAGIDEDNIRSEDFPGY